MTPQSIIADGHKALFIALAVASPMLGFGLIVGLMVSIFQAVTQIQEMTLTFVPKILAVVVAAVVFGKWILAMMTNYTYHLLYYLPETLIRDILR